MKTGQFSYDGVANFFNVSVLKNVSIKTPAGEQKGYMVFVPEDSMKDLKAKIDVETGETTPSKGQRAAVGAKNGDQWGMAFVDDIGLQLSLMKLNDIKKRETIF